RGATRAPPGRPSDRQRRQPLAAERDPRPAVVPGARSAARARPPRRQSRAPHPAGRRRADVCHRRVRRRAARERAPKAPRAHTRLRPVLALQPPGGLGSSWRAVPPRPAASRRSRDAAPPCHGFALPRGGATDAGSEGTTMSLTIPAPIPKGRVHTRDYLERIGVPELPACTSPFDPGYDPVTLESHLAQSAHLISILKISMACWMVAAEDATRQKLAAAGRHGVPTVTGGGPFEVA